MKTKKSISSSTNGQQGFVLFTVVMSIMALSYFALATMNEAGNMLSVSRFGERSLDRLEAPRLVGAFCARIAISSHPDYGPAMVASGFNTNWDANNPVFTQNNAFNNPALITSLTGTKTDDTGSFVVDTAEDAGIPSISVGTPQNGYTYFIDPDIEGEFSIPSEDCAMLEKYGLVAAGACGSVSGLLHAMNGLASCVGNAYSIACDGNTTFTVSEDGTTTGGLAQRTNYMLVSCDVRYQENRFLQADGSLDTTRPYNSMALSYRFDSVNISPSSF